MKKALCAALVSLSAVLAAGETKNVFYYDESFPRSGNQEYLAERCKLDIYLPDNVRNFPTLIWFHGGGLSTGEKHLPQGIDLTKIAVVTVNYRLSGTKAHCPDYLNDAAAAAAWVKKHIAEYGGDPNKVYISGHSAGAYLSVMLALAPEYLGAFQERPESFAGYYPVSGQMSTHFAILAERRAKDPKTPDIYLDEFAPISRSREKVPPVTLLVGDPEVEWPARVEENYLLAARLKRNFGCENIRIYAFPTFNHKTVLSPALYFISQDILLKTGKKK